MNIKKTLFIICTLIGLSACTSHKGFDLSKPLSLDTRPPEAPPVYQQGWVDGCESGLSATSEKMQLFFEVHKYHYDANLRYNNMYDKAWQYAYKHCAFSLKSINAYKYL